MGLDFSSFEEIYGIILQYIVQLFVYKSTKIYEIISLQSISS